MNHPIITTSSMIMNRKSQHTQTTNMQSASERNSIVRTLQLLLTAITMFFALGVQGAWAEDVTLFYTNFSTDDGWSTESIITSTKTEDTKIIKDVTLSFKGYKTSDLTVTVGATSSANGTLTFTGSNITSDGTNYYMAIPLTGVNKSITVTTTGDATKWYYAYKDGNMAVSARAQATANGGFTISGLSNSDVILYIGSSGKKLNSIKITTPESSGEISHDATLKAITINGAGIDGFASATKAYNVTLAYGTANVPTVAATAIDANATVNVTQASALPGNATINVTAEDGTTTDAYTVNLSVSSTAPTIPNGYDKFWRAEDWDKMTASTSQTTVNGATIYNVAIDASGEVTHEDLGTVTKRFNFGGTGGVDSRRIMIPITGPCTVTVFGSNGNVGRSITISDGTVTSQVCEITDGNKNTILKESYEYTGSSDKLYLYSTSSGIYIYGFGIKYSTPDPVDPTPEEDVIPFSITEEQGAQNTPDGWEAVQLPQIPEITEANTIYINNATYGASTSSNDNTTAIQAALNAVPAEGGMVVVPAGTWLSGPLTIKSKTVLHLKAGATLKLLPYGNGADGKTASAAGYYPTNGTNDKGKFNYKMFLTCVKSVSTSDIVVEGEGETSIIDGQGAQWWDKRDVLGTRPPLIRFEQGQRFLVRNIKLQNAPGTNLTLGNSGNASHFTVHDVTISNPSSESDQLQQGEVVSHNTDGIPVWGPYVNIYDCNISTGDDNIVADSDAHHLHAWNINCGYGHGMSIGSYTERLHDVIYEDITFTNTSSGFRIKTNNDRSGNDQVGTNENGAVKNIICRNATMTGVPGPIKITSWYDDDKQDPSTVSTPSAIVTKTPEFCNITFQNITADAVAGKTSWKHNSPIYIYGRPEMKIHDITFDKVRIASKRGMFLAYCEDVNFTNGCRVTNETNSEEFISISHDYAVTGNYGQPIERTFQDFKVDFRYESGYQMITPATLPAGVEINGTFHDTQHGYNTTTITVPVDGPVKFTFGACGSGGNATVKNASNEVVATVDCKSGGCDTDTSFDHIATWIYNSTTPQTLTITTAQYIPFFYAEKCEFIPPVTVTYYDVDGTTPVGEPQEMEAGSGLVIKYGESDVTVPSGQKFRNWRVGSASGPKAVEGMSIAENTSLYALATDIEEVGTHYAPNLNNFNAEEHDVIVAVRNCSDGNGHGLNMGGSGEVEFKVAGKTKITLGRCRHANESAKYIIKTASASAGAKSGMRRAASDELFSTSAYSATDGETVDFDYDGEAGNLIITCDAQAYLHSLELTPVAATEPATLEDVTGDITWDWKDVTTVTSSALYNSSDAAIKLLDSTTPKNTDEVIMSTYADNHITFANTFNAAVISFKGTYPSRKNMAQAGILHFHTTVPGKIKVKFSDTGSSASASAIKRYLNVNGENTEYWTSRPTSGTEKSNDTKESGEIAVPAGDVYIKAMKEDGTSSTDVCFYKVVFTADAPAEPEDEVIFSMDVASTVTEKVSFAAGETALSDTYAVITGGTAVVRNGQSGAKDLINAQDEVLYFAMTNGNTNYKVTLSKALAAGDVITADIPNSSTERGLIFSSTKNSTPNPIPDGIVYVNGTSVNSLTYTVKETDTDLVGKTEFYILRSTGTGTYFKNFVITRPAPKPSRTFKDFEIDLTKDPVGDLPEGVTQVSYPQNGAAFNGSHGWMWYAVKFDVDGPVKITLGGCQYTGGTGDSYEAYVTDKTDAKVLDIPTKTATCKNVTGIYNVEGDNTLTVYCGQYCTGIKVEACDYIPQVTVKYYDVDKTMLLETEVVDGSSALAYNTSAVSKVTVADGKKYRGFWKNKADNKRVDEGFKLNADIELYPSVTDIETPTKTSEHTLNLVAAGFEMDEHDLISVSGGSMNAQHGWQLAKDQYMNVKVAGNATITVGLCQYAGGGDLVLQDASGKEVSRVAAKVASDGATHTFIYEGETGTLKLLATDNSTYIHSIKITHTGDLTLPVWSDEKNAYTFTTKSDAATNAKELLYVMSYVNGQTEHDKTIFIPKGTYDLGTAHNTSIPAGMHLIGESQDGVLIKNQPTEESINQTATFQIDGAGVTLENMTIKCRAPYTTGDGHNAERGVCIQDCGNGSYYKNVTLDGLQDTYYSNGAAGMKATFDNCIVRGNVDFFCGNGNITVNDSRLQIVTTHGSGGTAIICAPATYTTEEQGHVFNNCVVEAATSAVGCLTPGHSSNLKFNLARAWYAGGESTKGTDRTPRVTFTDTEFEIKQAADWGGSIGYAQTEERRVFNIVNTGVQFSDEAMVIDKTNKPFAYATANDRKDPASVSASNITGGGEYDIEKIMAAMEADGGYTVGTTKAINGKQATIVLQSANTKDSNGKETRVPMDDTILNAIKAHDIIVLDGSGTSTDFVLSQYIRLSNVNSKTIVGINGARLCTEWYLTDYFKSILENVPTSSGTGVNSASTAEGTGGSIEVIRNGQPYTDNIKEEGEYLTRKYLLEATGDKTEAYRNSGIFYIDHSSNIIIRNFKFVGPGSLDCAGYDLMAIIDDTHHCWVDHCEFIDGMDGNFDITNRSDFITVSWCQFRYTDRSYAHQNTNLVGSSDEKTDDRKKLNITFAYNEWGANCRARMPMARYGRIHMLNNYYNCAGNSEYAMNPRIESEFLVEGNYWERGVRRAYNPNGQAAVTWGNNNYYADKAADKAGSNTGDFTVTVPYQYSSIMLDPHKVPEVLTLNGGAKLYQKPYFTTNLGVADNTPGTPELEHKAELTEELKEDGLVFSVWAENAHTFQWYKQDIDVHGNTGDWTMLEGEQRNTYTYKPVTGVEFNLKCQAFGVSGETTSDILKVKIDGLAAPYYLGGIPEEMQTVYTGTPMTFTANFKDAQGYQWYKSATEDRAGATAIDGATSNTYTYEPSSAEIFYLYCVASNSNGKGDGYSDVVKVKGVYRDIKFHYYGDYNYEEGHSEEVVVGGTGGLYPNTEPSQSTFHTDCTTETNKCTASLNSIGTDALHDKISGLRFENKDTHTTETFFADNTYVLFNLNNALVAGQTVRLSGFTGKTDSPNEKFGFYVCTSATKTADNTVATLKLTQKKNTLEYAEAVVPVSCAGAEKLYVIPFVDKAGRDITLHELMVYDGEMIPADDPTVTVETESPVSAKVGNEVVVRITATDAQSYQWYKNSTEELVFDEEHKIAGQTNANLSYTPEAEGTEYVYCRVIGKKADTHVDTPIIQLNISEASASQSGTLAVTWPLVDNSNNYTAAPVATLTGDITVENDVLSSKDNAAVGSKLTQNGVLVAQFTDDKTTKYYANYKPTTSENLTTDNLVVDENAYVKFTFTPKVSFKPTKVSFLATINGTGNGGFQPVLVYGSGAEEKVNLSASTLFKRDTGIKSTETKYECLISDLTINPSTPVTIYLYVGGKITNARNVLFKDVKIEGEYIKEELTQCLTPSVVKGNWDAEHQQWEYTLACAQPETAKIHYKIGDADAVEAPTNPVTIKVSEDVAFSVWASDPETDPDAKLKDSKTVEMTGDVRPQLAAPSILFATYKVAAPAERGFLVTLTDNNSDVENVAIHYTTDGSEPTTESAAYTAPFLVGGDVTVKAIATKTYYASSKEESAKTLPVNSEGAETTTNKNTNNHYSTVGENVGFAYTYNDNDKTVQNANKLSDGLKFTTNAALSIDGKTGFAIKVNPGFVITKVVATKATTNNDAGSMTFGDVYVDGQKNGTLDKKLPYYGGSNDANAITFTVAENIAAKEKIEVVVTSSDVKNNQANVLFTIFYEFDDAPASVTITDSKNGEDIITLNETEMATFMSSHEYTVNLEKVYAEDPIVKITTEKGYEYIVPAGEIETEGDKLTHFTKSFVGVEYTVKAKVNAVKSPNIEIANDMSLKGGYKVTLTYSKEDGIYPYINVDNTGWVAYDPEKEYFALGTVKSKMMYGSEQSLETVAREASCPTNSYTTGKPFAVYLYVNGYSDNQVGTHAYNNESFKTDKIYQAVANQFNVIPLAVDNSKSILDYRSDINDAKLVVITESLGGSGSVEIAGVGNKSTQMALSLKRDVLDKTNVLNMKMFMNGSSSANNLRWQWAQPRAMASELTSIMPCTPDGGGMYEIFGNATMSRDASINLWDDINTENMLYHLQPVFNFNEENETRPNFTPLALVIDPEEPEDQREEYHAIHFYENNGFQYIGFGLSINEWTQYNENVYAIIDKIGEMIKDDKPLDSKLTGIVKPTITDNGDGSANVFNNNPNADTYYKVYTQSEYEALNGTVPAAADLISGGIKANDTDFHTQKYTEKKHIFAVSKLGADAESEVVSGTVEGNSIRYVIRENDDPAAQGMVAKYPFTVGENFNMPYNQSWKKDGYTVTKWIAENGTEYTPGQEVSGLTQDITVKAIWTENTHKITDLGKDEDKTHRTVTWEFLQSKGAPALALENKAGNMQAILVGQAKFSDGTFIDVPMTINTDNLATLPDNGTEYHGKFNNTSTNWAKSLTDGDKEYTGSDYAQVRTGTQFTFPAVYGMNVVYKQVDLIEAVNGEANGNVNRSQVSQSYLTDGTKTADALKNWRFVNPGFQLDANGKVVMVDGKAQLAKTSPMYEAFKAKGQALGLYDEVIGGNHVNGGLIYYTGDGTEATMTSIESAQYIHVGADTGKKLGALNYGSVFMQSLSVVYPELYDLTCTWNPENSVLDPDEHPGKIEKLNDPRPNCGGRYVLNDDIVLKLTPAYGYYVDVDNDEVRSGDVVTKEAYYFLKNGMSATSALDITNGGVITTSKIYRYKDAGYADYSDDIKANIPEDGAYITMKVMDIDLVVSMKKLETVRYNVEVEPSTYGYITYNTGNGRPHEDEYDEFPVGKKLYVTAHPNTGYKFKEWRRKGGSGELISTLSIPNITLGDGVMVNPFDKSDYLETNELMFIAGTDNHGYNDNHKDDFTYVAVFEKAVTGTGYYEFDYALLKTAEGQTHNTMTPIEVTDDDKNQFPSEFTSQLLNFPKCYTLFKPGYTLDHWVEISGMDETIDGKHVFTPGTFVGDDFTPSTGGNYTFGKAYNPGSYYNFETEGEIKHLVPVFKKNPTSYDYRATPVDITWDLRVAQRAQRVNFKSGTSGNTAADTKIYYSTQAIINGDVHIDVPLTITLGKKGKLVNDIEEEDKWCAMGEGTTIVIPSGLGAKFTIASLSKMETTTIDGVVPTSYTVEKIDDADVYLYTFTTTSESTSVTLKIGDDYTYYKYIRAELPAADAVPLTVTVNNDAFGTVDIAAARTTADTEDNAPLLAKINATKEPLPTRALNSGHSYTLGLGTIVSLHAKRSHLYVLDYFEDGDGHRYYYNKDDGTKHLTVKDMDGNDITADATAVDEYLKMEKVQDFNTVTSLNDIQLTFQVQSYSESMHAVYKENTLYQVNYTSGEEAEGEAPGMTLVEDGESFMIPAENHHLYLDGQTLRYWVDEDGNKYDLGQSYTLGQTFTASKNLPSGIASGKGFTVPKKDIFLTPVFKVNDFTVMNLSQTATAKWPLSRKGGATYEGNGDIVINFEGINGIYVTPLKLENGDFIDLKMDIRGENGKANNVNSTDRCQVNSGTVFGLPSSSNCTFTLNSANSSISAKIDGTAVEGQQTVSSTYTGDKTQIDVQFTGNTYLYEVVAEYKPVTTELPELDYATVGNISLGALGTPLAGVKLSTLKSAGEVSGVPADLRNSTTGIMPVVRGTATRGGYVEVIQATIDNPVATMLVKTRDGVTVSVYKIGFDVTYPDIAPRVTDLKVDRKFQCDLKKMYENAIEDTRVDGTNYLNDDAYLRHLGVEGDNAANERVAINGVINIKFSTKMAETTLPASTFLANGTGVALGQAVYALEGQTLTFTYKGLDVNTEYDFIIPAGTFKDIFWEESTDANKPNHIYNQPIRIHFTTVETAISTDRRVINYVVTHNQASHFDVEQAKMVADGEPVQVASNELIKNLEAAGIEHGTLDNGVKLANAYKESGKRFYIFVPDGEYQLMGNDVVKSVSSPIGEDGKVISALNGKANVYNGITTVSHDNVSITGQSQEKTIVYNHPAFEGLSNASTLKLNNGIANFYAQDMTLQNRFDFLRCRKVSSKAVAPALWDRSSKPIFKNVKFDSYQDTYYTNANNQFDDTRGYAENCTIMGYVDFICGDGDDWFQNCNMVVRQGVGSTATNMFAPRQYDTQKWGYVMNQCTFSAENNTAFDVNNGKMTIARPWANSPAETLIECKYDVLSTDDGYKKMTGGGLILRMQEYKSYNSDGTILDLSKRSLRNSTPGIGSYDAVMTPSKAAEYNLFDVMGGEDGYDPTLYTAQVNMTSGIKQDDTFLTWDDQKEALCYFIFTSDTENGEYKLFAVTADTEFEMGNEQINKWFLVRAANQRGGLGEPTAAFQYKAHESYKRALVNNNQVIDGWRWSTIYLDFDAKAPVVQHEEMVDGEMKTIDEIYVYALVKVDATKLTFKRVKIMEKNCGYLIKARPRPEEYEFKYTEKTPVYYNGQTVPEYRTAQSLSESDFPQMSILNGSVVDVPAAGIAGYTLASKTSYGLGFYKYVGSTYNANYAWLDAALVAEAQKAMADGSLSSEAKAGFMLMVFDDDITEEESGVATDLDGISNRHLDDDDAIYNLAGQRINPAQMQRGMIYIIGGKKIRY